MNDDDRHGRGPRRDGAGGRSRGRSGAGRTLFDLGVFDQILREVSSWLDEEDFPGRRPSGGPGRGAARGGRDGTVVDGDVVERGTAPVEPADDADAAGYEDERAGTDGSLRGRGPKGYRRSNKRVKELVSDALYDDGRLDASDVVVSVEDGEVTLSGRVATRRDKHRAENLAARAAGTRDVDNRLRVRASRPSPGGAPGDAAQDADDYGHP